MNLDHVCSRPWFVIAGASLVLASCATTGDSGAMSEDVASRIGAETNRICFTRNINDFRTLDGVNDAVLLGVNVNDWYFVELLGTCSTSQLRFAQSVGINTVGSAGCVTEGDELIFSDSVTFSGTGSPHDFRSCVITGIYEWMPDAEDGDSAQQDENAKPNG